jgi:uncharacterized membrane protein
MSAATLEASPSIVRVTHIVYGLHALGLVLGAFGAATVIGSFLFGWPSIIAVILNYIYRGEARGTWVESHFNWQIRTFWFAVLWALIVGGVSLILMLVLVQAIPAVLKAATCSPARRPAPARPPASCCRSCSASPTTRRRGRRPIRVLILTPTRELAAQVEESVRVYGKHLSTSPPP